jgi:hypothetical protein
MSAQQLQVRFAMLIVAEFTAGGVLGWLVCWFFLDWLPARWAASRTHGVKES